MAKREVNFPASTVEVKFLLLLSFFSLTNTSCTEMHAALLHTYLKGATCGLLFCFPLTGPSTCYLWLLLIEIDVVKNINIDNSALKRTDWNEWGFRHPPPVADSLPPVFWEGAWVFSAQDAKDQTSSKHAETGLRSSCFTCMAVFCLGFGDYEIQIQVPVIQVGLQFCCVLSWQI